MKQPLSIYVLYDSRMKNSDEIYNKLFTTLCRNPNKPMSDGLDIPVYLRTDIGETIKEIPIGFSEKTLILVLVDDNIVSSKIWYNYITKLFEDQDIHKDSLSIVGVKLSEYAFSFNKKLSARQFIALKDGEIDLHENTWKEFFFRLYNILIRILIGDEKNKLKIFISHSKKDGIGEKAAVEFRNYILKETKENTFFDVNDILDGNDFKEMIDEGIVPKYSLLAIINSDSYSSREWCKYEVLKAKESKKPSVLISIFEDKIDRVFPYMANMPCVRFKDNWEDILLLLLRTAVDQYYEQKLLQSIISSKNVENEFTSLPYTPEAYSFKFDDVKTKNVVYPEPPLTESELELLKSLSPKPDQEFVTPMQFMGYGINLEYRKIAMSIANVANADQMGFKPINVRDLSVEIVRHILITGAQLVYGGDLRHGGYTYLFRDIASQYGIYEHSEDKDKTYFINFFSWPYSENIDVHTQAEFRANRTEIVNVGKPEDVVDDNLQYNKYSDDYALAFALSLNKMRKEMEKAVDARIMLGGRERDFSGFVPGLYEEFNLAMKHKHPVYILGGFGGAAASLADIIENNRSLEELWEHLIADDKYRKHLDYFKNKGLDVNIDFLRKAEGNYTVLNNGLSEEENRILFHSQDTLEIVSIILNGLKNKLADA